MEDNILRIIPNNQSSFENDESLNNGSILDFSTFYGNCLEGDLENAPVVRLANDGPADAAAGAEIGLPEEHKREIASFDEHKDDIQVAKEQKDDIQIIEEPKREIVEKVEKNDEKASQNKENPSAYNLSVKEPVFYLETEKVKPNPYQPRRHFNPEALNELAESIREFGILQPLVVSRISEPTEWGEKVEYQLIAGERRLLAAKSIGIERVPAIVKDNPSERMKLEMAIIENLQRSDLNAIEMARAFARLADEFGLAQREIGLKVGKSRESVANTMRLLQLPFEAQKALIDGKISEAHARVILTVSNPEKQRALLGETLTFGLSVRELQSLADRFFPRAESQQKISGEPVKDIHLRQAEVHLAQALSLPVSINKKGGRGRVVINFATEEDFKNILNKLGVREI